MIRPPFHCDFGYNIRLGPDVFLNFNCVILDVVAVTIGAGTQIGPAVQIYTADHPRDPALRKTGAEFGRPVSIGQNVWIGGGAIILPGLTIGDDAVVGAGAVVTRDVPQGATVLGNPGASKEVSAHGSCPGRGAAFFMPLRRAGTVTSTSVRYGPGSAAHHAVKNGALRCVRGTPIWVIAPPNSPRRNILGPWSRNAKQRIVPAS